MIRTATNEDAEAIAEIYNYYVANTIVTFEEHAITKDEMANRIDSTLGDKLPWLIVEESKNVLGYAYASKWKGRCAYKHSVETTVYLDQSTTSKGLGTALYHSLLTKLKDEKLHVAIGGIALPNPSSIALHEKLGFEKVGQFNEVGNKFGSWVDVGYWQLTLNQYQAP